MKIKEGIIKVKDAIINALFPQDFSCIFCGRDIPSGNICDKCNNEEIYNNKNRCEICDSPIRDGNLICDHCKNNINKRHFKN